MGNLFDPMVEINKDILSNTSGVIAHQVNCQKVMGAGLAFAIRNKYPQAYHDYMAVPQWTLGMVVFSQVAPNLYIAHIAGQDTYKERGVRHTDYPALRAGLEQAAQFAKQKGLTLFVPHKIGCGLAGGDWREVQRLLQQVAATATICTPPPEVLKNNFPTYRR